MTEQQQETTATPVDPTPSGRDDSSRLLIGGSILAVVVVIGVVVSLVIAFRGDDGPLVPAGQGSAGQVDAPSETTEFEPDPYFDKMNRVVYIPLDDRGVILTQTTAPAGRKNSTPPAGVMLQRVHGNMVMPFSTSDGPTAFTANGIATGFARTPQGAGLAAAHYLGYAGSGNDRIAMLREAGLLVDSNGVVAEGERQNNAPGGLAESSAYLVLPNVRVNYNPDLSRVHFGGTVSTASGNKNIELWGDVVWRDGTGWILKVGDTSTLGTKIGTDFSSDGWAQWW